MMGGIGENIVGQLVTEALLKSIQLAIRVANDMRNFSRDQEQLHFRLQSEIPKLECVQRMLNHDKIARHIPDRDRHTYFHIVKNMHHLLLKYALKTCRTEEETKAVHLVSAEELFARYETHWQDKAISDPDRGTQQRWNEVKTRFIWAVFKKQSIERLVIGVETWGKCLANLISAVVPLILLRENFTAAEIANVTPSEQNMPPESMEIIVKNQILMGKRAEEEGMPLEPMPDFELQQSQLKFIALHRQTAKVFKDGDELDTERTELGGSSRRQWAQLWEDDCIKEGRVIVEFKEAPPVVSPSTVEIVTRELNLLVDELRRAAGRESTFRVFYCEGFYKSPENYGIVYHLPEGISSRTHRCESLGNILMKPDYTELLASDLQNRLDLAKSLATTLYHLHSVNWLHKSINPDNILLFGHVGPDDRVEFDWSAPYLVGFDASRSYTAQSGRLPPSTRWENRVYTHPGRQNTSAPDRFCKQFDIYSLGVVLLEIGLMQCFKQSKYRLDKAWTEIPAAQVCTRLVEMAREMRGVLGVMYAEIVKCCLKGDFEIAGDGEDENETLLMAAYRSEVCEKLDQIRVSAPVCRRTW
jgi:hypothetical protein